MVGTSVVRILHLCLLEAPPGLHTKRGPWPLLKEGSACHLPFLLLSSPRTLIPVGLGDTAAQARPSHFRMETEDVVGVDHHFGFNSQPLFAVT